MCWLELGTDGHRQREREREPDVPSTPTENKLNSGPNDSKLSDGLAKKGKTENARRHPAVRWSALLGAPATRGSESAGTWTDVPTGGGMRALPPGKAERRNRWPEGRLTQGGQAETATGSERNRRATATLGNVEPTRPRQNPAEERLTPPSSATAGEKARIKAGRYPAVRWSALLGAWNSESAEREHASHRRGNDGRCRRERLTEAEDDVPEGKRAPGANGNRRCPRSEREPACLSKTKQRGRAPNGPKLSDGGWRSKAWNSENAPPPASVRWSALLGAGLAEAETRFWNRLKGGLRRGNDGRCRRESSPEAGTPSPEGRESARTDGKTGKHSDARERCRRSGKTGTEGTAGLAEPKCIRRAQEKCRRKSPNGLKLSDRGWRSKAWKQEKSRPPASVRWSAWLGTAPAERTRWLGQRMPLRLQNGYGHAVGSKMATNRGTAPEVRPANGKGPKRNRDGGRTGTAATSNTEQGKRP